MSALIMSHPASHADEMLCHELIMQRLQLLANVSIVQLSSEMLPYHASNAEAGLRLSQQNGPALRSAE